MNVHVFTEDVKSVLGKATHVGVVGATPSGSLGKHAACAASAQMRAWLQTSAESSGVSAAHVTSVRNSSVLVSPGVKSSARHSIWLPTSEQPGSRVMSTNEVTAGTSS